MKALTAALLLFSAVQTYTATTSNTNDTTPRRRLDVAKGTPSFVEPVLNELRSRIKLFESSSKLSYIIFGNVIVALLVSTFYILVNVFLNGLRLAEREAIGESVRWSMTETCLALTMFREEVSVNMVG